MICSSHNECFFLMTVSGDANFQMQHTGMTLGGFIQPSVARSLIEVQANVEKGLCQRFLWLVPQPTIVKFDQLQQVEASFVDTIGKFCICRNRGVEKMAFTIHWFLLSRTNE